jgi:predicted nuclease of predicted toxin-antitoxin system
VRFVLDEDVDHGLIGDLLAGGHQAWSVQQGAMGSVTDEIVAVYGHNRGAAVITHDAEFSTWRKSRCVGQHIWLHCADIRAREVFMDHLDEVLAALHRHDDVWIEVTAETVTVVVAPWI